MMNTHPHIEDLERMALYRHTLPPEQVLRIADHVRNCAYCRDFLMEIDEFTHEMDNLSEERINWETARIVRLASGTSTGNVVVLRLQKEPHIEPGKSGFALAAKSEETQIGYYPVATLYSDDGRTLLRVLHERERSSYFFQLMSEFMERVPNALLAAPGHTPMMTDLDGSHRVPDSEIDIVQIASMYVYYPLDRMKTGPLSHGELTSHEGVVLASDDSTLHLSGDGTAVNVRMRWHGSDDAVPRFIGIVSSEGQAVGTFENGQARIPLGAVPDDGTLILY
jgi:hypothetical protein